MKALGMNCSLWNIFGLTVFGLGIIVLIKRGFLDPWWPFSKWVTSQTLKSWQSLLRESLENLIDWILLKTMYINNGSNLLSVWLQMQVIFRSFHLLKWHFFPFVKIQTLPPTPSMAKPLISKTTTFFLWLIFTSMH